MQEDKSKQRTASHVVGQPQKAAGNVDQGISGTRQKELWDDQDSKEKSLL